MNNEKIGPRLKPKFTLLSASRFKELSLSPSLLKHSYDMGIRGNSVISRPVMEFWPEHFEFCSWLIQKTSNGRPRSRLSLSYHRLCSKHIILIYNCEKYRFGSEVYTIYCAQFSGVWLERLNNITRQKSRLAEYPSVSARFEPNTMSLSIQLVKKKIYKHSLAGNWCAGFGMTNTMPKFRRKNDTINYA